MSERNRYEPGVPCWIAAVHPDPDAAAPFDTPISRTAALADPQGTTFTATTIRIWQ